MNLKPVKCRIIVEPQEAAAQTGFGLVLPPKLQEKPSEAKILAVGPGTRSIPMTAQVGETVLYRPGSGYKFSYEGKTYLTLKEDAILATK